jgi:hypothetical protein
MEKCPQCGTVHPPVSGICPMVASQKTDEQIKNDLKSEVGQGIVDVKEDLLRLFKKIDDTQLCLKHIQTIRILINKLPKQ